ncbi:hypothetical protein B9Z19DRAFT_1118521 [Tuber borchii]|uniref:Uncharacterized protein n=1 Tax=Tuber borchii TaxID=42251 RepID=A0A2T7A8D6_TUBBO|nr:hypothetical protein B9Z19DRAFT_1118521 [Tuber borchii]
MAGVSGITVESVDDITPGTIFLGHSSLPSHPQPKRRPFLALWKVGNQIVSLPLTSLASGGESVQIAAERFGRSTASYYPIAPSSNPPYLPVTATQNFSGFIDLLTPVTLGNSSLGRRARGTRISQRDLQSVIMAHVGLVQCGQEAVQTGQGEQESEMLLIDRRTHDSIRQMALEMLQCSEEGLLHARRTQEVTKSLVEAFDRPPAAKLILPRPQYPSPSLNSTHVDHPPPPPPPPPRSPQADIQQRHPAQQSSGQQQQQQQQQQQPLNSQYGSAGCRPNTFPGDPRNPESDGDGDGPPGTHTHWGSSNLSSAPTGSRSNKQRNRTPARRSGTNGNQVAQRQEECKQEGCQQEHQHEEDGNDEDGIDEWTKGDWAWVEEIIPEDKEKGKQPGEYSDSKPPSEWDPDDWDKLEDIIPEIATHLPPEDGSDSEGTQGNTVIPHPLLSPPFQEGQEEEPPSKDASDENDRRSNKSSSDRYNEHQRNFLPTSLPTQQPWAQSQFRTFTHALQRITARAQPQQEETSVPTAGSTGSESEDTEDIHSSGTEPQGVATTPPSAQATQTATPEEQAPTGQSKTMESETSPIRAVGPTETEGARG